ncbi:hypothetical protein IP86_02880 [Rhodopseudomonas sp. AAP120]|uniref:Uncharacterized protein n=1 Tax=Rhodopseudomonas palustris (strain BisB5) TaxID=316057 RepID=Q138Y1_RHOPS|nr:MULTISPECIES: hypothetical protein [Rhodopseudomonas]ABE39358.1 hypothetical protein RPD_2123 [Rhodopseudomonas palustris BisB5]ACF00794.1 hypothetical protein Rpal_2273 [Rhodopseudomonas palustris TIE-1]KPG01772.1 hypothetical protein IP86_02880 [Rhodopseudomonas sp. AAP120]
MVKDSKPKVAAAAAPRAKRQARPDDARSGRLILRAHPDLLQVLTVRARVAGISRSRYVERLLIAWLNADPRNPRMDAVGKIRTGFDQARHAAPSALARAERWTRYNSAHAALFGVPLPDSDFEDPEQEWDAAKTLIDVDAGGDDD